MDLEASRYDELGEGGGPGGNFGHKHQHSILLPPDRALSGPLSVN